MRIYKLICATIMPKQHSNPVLSVAITISSNILTSNRVTGQMTIFRDKIGIFFHPPDQPNPLYFTLFNFTVQILPNLDTLLVIGVQQSDEHDIYIFMNSSQARDNVTSTMRLLNFTIVDEFKHRMHISRNSRSHSLPSMSSIAEE